MANKYIDKFQQNDGDIFYIEPTKSHSGECTTAAATSLKTVTIEGVGSLETGTVIHVRFSKTNTAANPSLKVNTLDAKPIFQAYGSPAGSDSTRDGWQAGQWVTLIYDSAASGTNVGGWVFNKGYNTNNTYTVPGAYTGNAAALGTASPGTSGSWARGDHVHPTTGLALSDHVHGNITNNGAITSFKTTANGDFLIISDTSEDSQLTRGPVFGTSTASFLRNDGTWAVPPGTAHTLKIEASTGTSSIALAASSKYKLTAGGSTYIFTTPPDTWTAMDGATSSANGTAGYVPAPPSNGYNTKFLRADGTWAIPPDDNDNIWSTLGIKQSAGGDLDTYTTPGVYYWGGSSYNGAAGSTTAVDNCPVHSTGFRLVVTLGYGGTSYLHQFIFTSSSSIWHRFRMSSGDWTDWLTFSTSDHTHKYAGSSTAGGAATTALALTTDAGSTSVPVYFTDGKPSAITNLHINGTATVTGKVTLQKAVNGVMTGGTFTAGHSDTATSPTTYYPAKWIFDENITNIASGDIVYIQIPGIGISYGDYLSLDDGSNYYPIIYNTNSRLTTQFPSGAIIGLVYQTTGSAATIYPVDGSSASSTYNGGVWRVLNLYYVNTTYSVITAADVGNSAQTTGRLITGARFYTGMASHTVLPATTPTLDWGATTTIATIAGKALKVTMPSDPNTDTKVQQTVTTTNSTYPVLFTYTANQTATSTTGARFGTTVKINPSSGTIIATTFSGELQGTIDSTTTGTAVGIANVRNGTATTKIVTATDLRDAMRPLRTLMGSANGTSTSHKTVSLSLELADYEANMVGYYNYNDYTVTIPSNDSVAFPIGTSIIFSLWGSNSTITFSAASGVTIRKAAGYDTKMSTQGGVCALLKEHTNYWLLFGALD